MKYVLTDAAVRKLRGVLAPRSGNTGAGGAATPVSPDDFPRPWTVRWSQREANGSGAWCIYFPNVNTTGLVLSPLYYGTTAVVPTGLTASAVLGGTWYTLDNIPASSTAVWLNVVKPSGSGALTAYFTNTYPLPVQNATHWRIQVASLIVDATTGKRRIKQHLASAVNLSKADAEGGGGGGLSGTVEFVADNDWYVNGSVHQFRKRLRVLDLATGQVTDKARTTYANGWEVVTDTTPISQIIN